MAAGLGFKTFNTGDVLTAADVNGYLMQGVLVFADATARDAAITSPQEGQFAYTKDNNSLWYYTGSAWAASGATGDIEGVTAGVGISGGGTSGTVTITNSMATAIDAKGDLVAGTGADTFARLAVGTNSQFLQADSSTATGLKWADGAQYTLISTTALTSGTSVTISSIPATYKDLFLVIEGVQPNASANLSMNFNGTQNGNIYNIGWYANSAPTNPTLQGFNTGSEGIRLYGTSVRSGNGNSVYTVNVYNYADTTVYKTGDFRGWYLQGSNHGEAIGGFYAGQYTAAISSIVLFWTNGTSTFAGGNAFLYGRS